MIEGLKPYAEYKESGLPWLGSVPAHWDVKRLKNWVTINEMALPESTPGDFEFDYLDIGSVGTGRITKALNRLRFLGSPSRARRVIRTGDTIVSTVRTYLKAVLTICAVEKPLIASTGFAVLTPRGETIPKCLGYVTSSQSFTNEVTAESVGIAYPAISETKLANIPVTLPPPDEQAAIVRFLDHANRKIDGFIRAKRKLIGLRNEQKQAIIHRAVTRGLHPDVPLKPSGIPWLGDIPKHWDVKKLRHLTRQIVDGTHFTPTYRDEGVAFLRVTDIHTPLIDQSKLRRISKGEHAQLNKRCNPEKGDLLLSKNGTIGVTKVVDWDFPFSIFVSLCLIKPIKAAIDPYFMAFAFEGGLLERQLSEITKTTSVTNLHLEKIRGLIVPVPPLVEQANILRETRIVVTPVQEAIARTEREIALMQEYRTRLTADLVTGKLDVREAAAKLPDLPTDSAAEPLTDEALADTETEETE